MKNMVGRRKVASVLPPRLYAYKGKKKTTYYTRTKDNERIHLGSDLAEAKKELLRLEGETPKAGTIAELIADYIKEHLQPLVMQGKRSPRTLADREEQSANLNKAFGAMRPQDVTPNHIWKYLHTFRGKVAPVRANKEIIFLKAVFNWAREQGIVRDNPCTGVTLNEEKPRDRLVTDEEVNRFMRLATEDGDVSTRAALAFMIAYLTGKAQGQILKLKLPRDWQQSEGIDFSKRKGGARVFVYWSSLLKDAVAASLAMPSRVASLFVVHTQEGGPYTSDGFKKGWQMLMKKWVEGGTWKDGTTRKPGERFTFHDSRAKASTDVIEQGRKASELTGHRLESTVAKVYDRRAMRKSMPVR